MIRCGQLAQLARPRRRLFVAVRSAARTAQIGRAAVIFRKNPSLFVDQPAIQSLSQDILQETPQIFLKSTRSPERMPSGFFCKKTLTFSENRPVLHKLSHHFLRKPPRIFLKSTYSPTLIISFFSQKKTFGQCTAHMGAPERLVHNIHQRFNPYSNRTILAVPHLQ